MKKPDNIFDNLPNKKTSAEIFETLLENKNIKIERIISTGQTTPENQWYDQAQDEWVILLQGAARILFEDDSEVTLNSGDYIFIPAHKKHRVSFTDPEQVCVWIAVYMNKTAG